MGLTAADRNRNISERGIILDPVLQPTMVPSAVIKKLNLSVLIIWSN